MVLLDHVCKICIVSLEVDQFLNFYDCDRKMTLVDLDNYEDSDFTEGMKQRCYYKVKINGTSNLHTVWLPF